MHYFGISHLQQESCCPGFSRCILCFCLSIWVIRVVGWIFVVSGHPYSFIWYICDVEIRLSCSTADWGKPVNKPQLCLGCYAWLPAVLHEQRTNCRTVTTRRWKYSTGDNNRHCCSSSNWRGRKGTRTVQCGLQHLFPLGRKGKEMSGEHDRILELQRQKILSKGGR